MKKRQISDEQLYDRLMSAARLMISFITFIMAGGISFLLYTTYFLRHKVDILDFFLNIHFWLIAWGILFLLFFWVTIAGVGLIERWVHRGHD